MDKKILIQYKSIIQEIKDLEERINRINKIDKKRNAIIVDSVRGSLNTFPYTEHSIKIEGIPYCRPNSKKILYKKLLERAKEKLQDMQIKVEQYIQSIEDSRMRRILRYKYMDDKNWLQIAFLIGGTADSIRMEHNRFFDKN
jgi:hypothetical protein